MEKKKEEVSAICEREEKKIPQSFQSVFFQMKNGREKKNQIELHWSSMKDKIAYKDPEKWQISVEITSGRNK